MTSPERDDSALKDLISRAQEGDTEAFGSVYDHFFLQVYRYVAFRVPEEIAEDLVADIFVKAWEKLGSYKPQKKVPFGAWLFRIARNVVIDAYRSQRGFEEISEETKDPDALNEADTATKRKDVITIVRKALNQLPSRYREVLLLTFISELPNDEAARVLRTTTGGLRILKFRALKKLEEFIPPDLQET